MKMGDKNNKKQSQIYNMSTSKLSTNKCSHFFKELGRNSVNLLPTNIMANNTECKQRKHLHAESKKRRYLRYQLFTGEASNTPGKKLPEESWLAPKWENI